MKRLGIFYFDNVNRVVDKYIEYLLDDVMNNVSYLIIICCETLDRDNKNKLENYTKDIVILDDFAVEFYAYKDILKNYIGFNKLNNYNELLIFNNNFYGPIYQLKEIFDKMNTKKCDFWGLINRGKIIDCENKEEIDLDFFVIRSGLLNSKHFEDFWLNLTDYENFEYDFKTYFEELNFISDVFVDIYSYEKKYFLRPIDWSIKKPIELMKYYKFPIIKRKSLFKETNLVSSGKYILEYIKDYTNYDIDMIWDYIIKNYNVQQIYQEVGLHYVLSDSSSINFETDDKVAVLIHLYYEETVFECFEYIRNIPSFIDIYITTMQETTYIKVKDLSKNQNNIKKIIYLPNRGRDIAALLVGFSEYTNQYDIFCFIHDKISHKNSTIIIGEGFRKTGWNSMLKNNHYIKNALNIFKENPRIGMLVAPYPKYSAETNVMIDWWYGTLHNTVKLLDRIGVESDKVDSRYPPLTIGTTFWCRADAINQLINYEFVIEDFPKEPLGSPENGAINYAVEMIFSFIAQKNGYSTAVIESVDLAENKLLLNNNMRIYSVGYFKTKYYIKRYEKCYIYGCGEIAKRLTKQISIYDLEIDGYIVSDLKNQKNMFLGCPVYQLDQIDDLDRSGIIIGLNKMNTIEVSAYLKKHSVNNYATLEDIELDW